MIEVAVSQQDFVKPLEAQAALQNLTLGTFAAIDLIAVLFVQHNIRRQAPMYRRCGSGSSQEYNFKH